MNDHKHDPWSNEHLYDEPTASFGGQCPRCGNVGIWLTPRGIIAECPNLQLKFNDHPAMNEAAEKVLRAGRHLADCGLIASPVCFDVARALTQFTTLGPCGREYLMDKYFRWSKAGRLREFHAVIEQLRRVWLLPVASRGSTPAGYWIALSQADFAEWVERAAKPSRTKLATIFRLAKSHWPVYGKQLELEFGDELVGVEAEVAA